MILQDWFNDNMPDEVGMVYGKSAVNQILWVRDTLSFMILPCLMGSEWDFKKSKKALTVEGTHTSKSILLPVYKFEAKGIKIKLRGNFHDWCVRVWGVMVKPFPEWMNVHRDRGYFEGMDDDNSPISFCIRSREELFAVLWWMLNEGVVSSSAACPV